jgi:hypothetical protein
MHVHAAAYTISHLLAGPNSGLVSMKLRKQLHDPLRPKRPSPTATTSRLPSLSDLGESRSTIAAPGATVAHVLRTLQAITLNAPPGSKIWQFLIEPILPLLFSLSASLTTSGKGKAKAKVVAIDEDQDDWAGIVRGLIEGWGRVSEAEEVESGLWQVLQGGRGWKSDALDAHDSDDGEFLWGTDEGAPCIMFGE